MTAAPNHPAAWAAANEILKKEKTPRYRLLARAYLALAEREREAEGAAHQLAVEDRQAHRSDRKGDDMIVQNELEKYAAAASVELRQKSLHDIQVETAKVWCGRSIAARYEGLHQDAVEYAHEAIEHAALSGDNDLLDRIRTALYERGVAL